MSIKDFDASSKKAERPAFRITGQTFTCRAKLSFRKWKSLFANMDDSSGEAMNTVEDFFDAVLLPGDRERFKELLDGDEEDDENVIELSVINEIAQWLMEHYSGNASGQPTT